MVMTAKIFITVMLVLAYIVKMIDFVNTSIYFGKFSPDIYEFIGMILGLIVRTGSIILIWTNDIDSKITYTLHL